MASLTSLASVECDSLYFTGPGQVAVKTEPIQPPSTGQLLIRTHLSAISPGTERLILRGQVASDLALDESIAGLDGSFKYPFKYGYAAIGQVIKVGANVSTDWQDRWVFAFHPHESHFLTTPDHVIPLPEGVTVADAVFLPNVETAVNLILDGSPLLGENIIVFGQGIVGLLTTTLLAQFPLNSLTTVDTQPSRQQQSRDAGADQSFTPSQVTDWVSEQTFDKADLIYELSGNPAALDQAVALTGFGGRIVVGSWYGTKPATLDLGSHFHRGRQRIISSQVSTIAPELLGRWQKKRRIDLAWRKLQQIKPSRFISHRFPIDQAAQAYKLLDQEAADVMQIVLTYT
ncbi:MAG: zinc-binding alcohol dehydrogenase [Chloroflexota bacterium]